VIDQEDGERVGALSSFRRTGLWSFLFYLTPTLHKDLNCLSPTYLQSSWCGIHHSKIQN